MLYCHQDSVFGVFCQVVIKILQPLYYEYNHRLIVNQVNHLSIRRLVPLCIHPNSPLTQWSLQDFPAGGRRFLECLNTSNTGAPVAKVIKNSTPFTEPQSSLQFSKGPLPLHRKLFPEPHESRSYLSRIHSDVIHQFIPVSSWVSLLFTFPD